MSTTPQQQAVEEIVDTMMAEVINTMAESQPLHKLKMRLLVHLRGGQRDLEMLEASGDYVYDGVAY